MDDSILNSIKKLLGITEDYTHFDTDIIVHINSVFMILNQLGIGPNNGFSIRDKNTKWNEYVSDDANLESIKTYMFMRVRLLFDPPSSSIITEVMNKQISEFEWRLNVLAESQKNQND